MIGFWNYTMILTYMSLLSAVAGIIVSLHDTGHPYMGMFFLLICGLCDTFDGRVARTKKNRTPLEKEFGVKGLKIYMEYRNGDGSVIYGDNIN